MKTLLLVCGVLSLLTSALAYPLAGALSAGATEAYIISAKDPGLIATEKMIFEAPKAPKESPEYRKAVMSIYGLPVDEPTPVVFVDASKFIRPEELPSLTLLPVDKTKGENPLQVKTLYFFASRIAIGAGVSGVVLLLIWAFLRGKKAPPPSPAVPAA